MNTETKFHYFSATLFLISSIVFYISDEVAFGILFSFLAISFFTIAADNQKKGKTNKNDSDDKI